MDPTENPDGGESQWSSTPFGTDKDSSTHVQPADVGEANQALPGEQDDPRLC